MILIFPPLSIQGCWGCTANFFGNSAVVPAQLAKLKYPATFGGCERSFANGRHEFRQKKLWINMHYTKTQWHVTVFEDFMSLWVHSGRILTKILYMSKSLQAWDVVSDELGSKSGMCVIGLDTNIIGTTKRNRLCTLNNLCHTLRICLHQDPKLPTLQILWPLQYNPSILFLSLSHSQYSHRRAKSGWYERVEGVQIYQSAMTEPGSNRISWLIVISMSSDLLDSKIPIR